MKTCYHLHAIGDGTATLGVNNASADLELMFDKRGKLCYNTIISEKTS